jgi:hypothetical protein
MARQTQRAARDAASPLDARAPAVADRLQAHSDRQARAATAPLLVKEAAAGVT